MLSGLLFSCDTAQKDQIAFSGMFFPLHVLYSSWTSTKYGSRVGSVKMIFFFCFFVFFVLSSAVFKENVKILS